ncbi:PDZ and LIM domain protein Zasp [Caerostris extrusa]|uniref:PDZ and LIM domain protein Zasp n=1 Tax=Caerostris extrusa TaxID=172846 RepID=A0AAV4Y7B3_CAEEX|nr:PDZ and LIM domain protein Zasp [Caerostris extrusa]
MKEPQPVNKESAVYRMIMEEKQGGGAQTTDGLNHVDGPYRKDSPMTQQSVTQHVAAPITKPPSQTGDKPNAPNCCPECGKTIIGVFNVGYFNVNDKLYCDAHAKLAAKIAASMPTYEPLVISQPSDPVPPPISNPLSPTPRTPISDPLSPMAFRSVSPVPFHRPGEVHHVEAPQSPQPVLSPPVFKPTTPSFPSAAPAPSFKMMTPQSQAPVAPPSAPIGNVISTTGTGGPGHKFVWPPQKNAPAPESILTSNVPPTLPSYRPPPGTQHATPAPKFSTSTSPTPKISSPTPQTNFNTSFSGPKVPPVTSPKPRNPVQSGKVQTWNMSSSVTTTSTSSDLQSGVAMNAGTGSRPAPKRGRGQMKPQAASGARIPICQMCGTPIRGPFVVALGKSWCPDHFVCANNRCQTSLVNIGFVEDRGQLYCENCYEVHLAPSCSKCGKRIKGDCLNALDKQWHPNCFICCYCSKPFGNSSFYMEDGMPYCEKDWNELFTTKCVGCGFPIEAGDRWVEALNNNYHSQCFKCTKCLKGLEGQSFYAKGGKPYCKIHSRD